ELTFACRIVREVAEGAVERLDAIAYARVDHSRDRVVPQVLLIERARGAASSGIGEYAVIGMATSDPGRLHAPRCSEVGRPQAHAVHAGARGCDLLDVGDAFRRLQDGMDQNRLLDAALCFELREQLVEI